MFKNNLKHWLKFDHATFLLIAPAIIFDYKYIALTLWCMALIYDIYEQKKKEQTKWQTLIKVH